MKYILIILFLCVVFSIVFSIIKSKKLSKEKFSKENYVRPLYTRDELKSILYPIRDCQNNLFGQIITIDTQNSSFLKEYNIDKITIPKNYNLSTKDNKYNQNMLPQIGNQGLCGCCWAYGVQCLLYFLTISNGIIQQIDYLFFLPSIKGLIDCLSKNNNIPICDPNIPCKGCAGCNNRYVFQNVFNKLKPLCNEMAMDSQNIKCYTKNSNEAGKSNIKFDCSTVKLYDFPGCGTCSLDGSSSTFISKANIYIPPIDSIHIVYKGVSRSKLELSKDEILLLKQCLFVFGPLNFTYPGASNNSFLEYKGGIYNGDILLNDPSLGNQDDLLHNMTLVGWDNIKYLGVLSKECWIVRNSWGTNWGAQGYMYIPTNKNIFYKTTQNGYAQILGIIESRYCITQNSVKQNRPTICQISIIDKVNYIQNNSKVKILVKCYLGISVKYLSLSFTIESSVIDNSYSSVNFIPISITDCGNSSPKFYVDSKGIVFNEDNYPVTLVNEYYYKDENRKLYAQDNSEKNFFIYELDIDLDKLLYNSRWHLKIIATTENEQGTNIIGANDIYINWTLKIKKQKTEVLQPQDSATGATALYYTKFEVLLPINEQFKLASNKYNYDVTFPNNNIFPDNGSSIIPSFVPGTGTIGLPLMPGIYYYISNSSAANYAVFYDNNLNIISTKI